jgi:hypothetical protein
MSMTKERSYSHSIGGDITWQVIGYTDVGGVAKVEQTALVKTNEESLARFLAGQLLMWQFARGTEEWRKSLIGYSAELRRGRREGPLDTGLWTPERPDDPVADIAYLDADSGSIEWDLNAPTYTVVSPHPYYQKVIPLVGRTDDRVTPIEWVSLRSTVTGAVLVS